MLHKAYFSKKYKKPSNTFIKWMLSYISILIIPLLAFSVYFSHTFKVIKNETMIRQHLSLENVKAQLDSNLNDLIKISTNLSMNHQVNSLSYKTISSSKLHLQIKDLHDELAIYMVTNSFIKEIYIYFPGNDYIVSSSTVYKYQITNFMPTRYISKETWKYLKNNLHKNSYQLLFEKQHDSQLLFSQPLLINNKTNKPLSIIIYEINLQSISTFLESQVLSSNFSALTLMNDVTVMLTTATEVMEQLQASNALKSNVSNKTNYIIDSIDLHLSGLKLMSLTEESVYYSEISNMLIVLYIALSISVLIGVIITLFYSVHNYRPLKEIMGYIIAYPSDQNEKNEYSKIKNMIIRTNSEIQTQRNILKNNYLNKLLTGEIHLSQVSLTVAEQFHLNFPSDFFYVVLLRFSAFNHKQENSVHEELKSPKNDLAYFIVQNILSELFQTVFHNLYFCYNQAEIAMIVNLSEDEGRANTILSDGLNTFIEYCKNHFDIDFYVGVSALCNNKHLSDAYSQAGNTLEYMHLFGIGTLLNYEDTPKESQLGYLNLKTSDYIINLVMLANDQTLKNYFITIYQELNQKKLSSEDAKSCLYFFYTVSMKLKTRLQYKYPYRSSESIFNLNSQFFNYSLPEAIHYIEELYLQSVRMIKEQSSYNTDYRIQEVAQYIDSNYFDINLNLNYIADHFNITPSYLSKKFREKNGLSIIDYLYQIRISHSLKLINDTSLKITDIAQMVGFQDSNAFIRIFKKYHGCTPGNYKFNVQNPVETRKSP